MFDVNNDGYDDLICHTSTGIIQISESHIVKQHMGEVTSVDETIQPSLTSFDGQQTMTGFHGGQTMAGGQTVAGGQTMAGGQFMAGDPFMAGDQT